MPYGGTRKRITRSKRYTAGARTRRSSALTKARRAPVKTVARNTRAISRLKSAVNGHIQKSFQRVKWDAGFTGFIRRTPVAFAMNDFTEVSQGGAVYFPTYAGVAPNLTTAAGVAGTWGKVIPSAVLGLQDEFNMWRDVQDDNVSLEAYQPISARHSFRFNRLVSPLGQEDNWLRIDIFTIKKTLQYSTANKWVLPNALGALAGMANTETIAPARNAFNRELFTVKRTKWLKLPGNKTSSVPITTSCRCNLTQYFSKKLLKVDLTIGGTQAENFCFAVDPKEVVWCMVSGDDEPILDASPIEATFTRHITWRDQHGVAA